MPCSSFSLHLLQLSAPEASWPALSVLERLHQAIWIFDIDGSRVVWANDAALQIWRADNLSELMCRQMGEDMSPGVSRRLRQFQQDFSQSDARFHETWTIYPRGEPLTLNMHLSGIRLTDGRMAMLCEVLGVHQTDPVSLRSTEALLHTSVMISLFRRSDGSVLYRNAAARAAARGGSLSLSAHFIDPQDIDQLMSQLAAEGEGRCQARMLTQAGLRWHDVSAKVAHDAVTGEEALVLSEVDISDLKRAEAHARYLALHDNLTGLPNRHFVKQAFAERLHRAEATGSEAALLFIDLDHFKNVNDSLGHAVGDELLIRIGQRLRDEVGPHDLVARLGGDEFLALVFGEQANMLAQRLAERLLVALAGGISIGQAELRVTPSIGVSLFPRDGRDLEALMLHADMAMTQAKQMGRHRMGWFSPELRTQVQARLLLEGELRNALARGEFELHYQPRITIDGGRIVGAEALVRWHHPARGLVAPAAFIPACEDIGLIGELGAWVLREAAQQQVAWAQAGMPLSMSVNLSPRQFNDVNLLDTVDRIIFETGCQPSSIELEITESVLLAEDGSTLDVLRALRERGFRIAIDDFGTGYSSLAYLRRYPVDVLKIDRAFVDSIDEHQPITSLIIGLARALGLGLVAEGVETLAQLNWLRSQNCDDFQGNLASPPLPAPVFESLARDHWLLGFQWPAANRLVSPANASA